MLETLEPQTPKKSDVDTGNPHNASNEPLVVSFTHQEAIKFVDSVAQNLATGKPNPIEPSPATDKIGQAIYMAALREYDSELKAADRSLTPTAKPQTPGDTQSEKKNQPKQKTTTEPETALAKTGAVYAKLLESQQGRQQIYSALGITAETKEDYRLVAYQDNLRTVVFKGKYEGDGMLTLTDKIVIVDTGALSKDLVAGKIEFEKLKTPITIEDKSLVPAKEAGEKKQLGHDIQLPKEKLEKLQSTVALLALVDQYHDKAAVALGGSIPFNKLGISGLSVA